MKSKIKHTVLNTVLAAAMAMSCVSYGGFRIAATDNPTTDIVTQNETSYAKVIGITQNSDNTVTITLDKKIKKSNMSASSSEGGQWVYDGNLSLTSNKVPATGEFFVNVILTEVDEQVSYHNLYRNAEGEWSVVVEYIKNADEDLNPRLYIQIGNDLVEIENYKDYITGNPYVIQETFTASPKIVVKGYDLSYLKTQYTGGGGYASEFLPDPMGNHTQLEAELLKNGKETVSGRYSLTIKSNVTRSIFMPQLLITYKAADRTALNEKLDEAKTLSSKGYTEESYAALQLEIEKASAVSTSNISTQSEIDSAVSSLQNAIDGLSTEVVKPEILNITTDSDGTIRIELSSKPKGSFTKPRAGYHTFKYVEEDGKIYAVPMTTTIPEEGEFYNVLSFELLQEDAEGNLYVNYWMYRDEEGRFTYGKIPSNDELTAPDVTIQVGDESHIIPTSTPGKTPVINVSKGEDVTVNINGIAIDLVRYSDPSFGYVSPNPTVGGDHQSVSFDLVDKSGNLSGGYYTFEVQRDKTISSTSQNLTLNQYFNTYDVEIVVLEADKSKLQELYDDVKDYESTNAYYKYFAQELENAKTILDDPKATQDQVDMKVDQLSGKYYALLVAEMNSMYSPTNGSEDLMKYTTDSLKPVINMWGITHNRTNNNYEENASIGNVGQMKGWYEEYLKAIDGLVEATEEDQYIGLSVSATKTGIYQGNFEVIGQKVVEVNGVKKIRLTIQFKNDGLHPIYGAELPNANGSTVFKKFISISQKEAAARVSVYDADLIFKMSGGLQNVTPLEGENNYYKGFQGTYDVDPSNEYITVRFAKSNDETYSPWYYRIAEMDLTDPEVVKIVPNSDGTVTVKFSEPVTIEDEEWAVSEKPYEEGGQYWVGTLTEDKFYTVTAKDYAGNSVEFTVDHEKPQPVVSYSTTDPTNKEVIVTVTFPNEEKFVYLTSSTENPGWTNIAGTNQWQKAFSANATETVRFHDYMNNEASVEVKVDNIDTIGPELGVEYSTDQPTNSSVIVTIKSDEPLDSTQLPEGWTLSEDGLTAIKTYEENVDETVTFADTLGNTSEIEISVHNIDKTIPVIELTEKNVVISTGDAFDPMDLVVSVKDGEVDLSESLVISEEPKIDTNKEGTYVITYEVKDAAGNTAKETVILTVNPKMTEINAVPIITANDQTLNIHEPFDALANVSATDKEEGDLSDRIKVIANDVDTTKAGTYHVTYQVSDSTGGTSVKTITVVVIDHTVPSDPQDPTDPSTPNQPNESGEEKPSNTPESPSTHDQSMMAVYMGLLAASAWMLAVLLRRKKEVN